MISRSCYGFETSLIRICNINRQKYLFVIIQIQFCDITGLLCDMTKIDSFLKPLAQQVNSYIKDTNQFLQKLNNLGQLPENSLLVTTDVVSLYTKLPHHQGILAAKDALEKQEIKEPKTWVLLRLLHFILTKTFKFNEQYYEQISGTTMGTKCAPSYAILFMSKFEEDFLAKRFYKPLVWWRYIDDIFMIWPHLREELYSFSEALNNFTKRWNLRQISARTGPIFFM